MFRPSFRRVLLAGALCMALGAACTAPNGRYPNDGQPEPDASPDEGADAGPTCEPDAFVGCAGQQLLRCSPTGTAVLVEDCHPYLCNPQTELCNTCDPAVQLRCDGDDLVFCTAMGVPVRYFCKHGCMVDHCLGCAMETFYFDGDGDGHGDPATALETCQPPKGYVAAGDDCDDADPRAYPGQVGFFSTSTEGTGGYDFDCDGTEEQEYPGAVWCQGSGTACEGDGWTLGVPGCGESGLLARCVPYLGLACGPVTWLEVQRCR